MGQNYGVSFASKLIEDGQYEAALAAASKDAERDPADPEPFLDRAVALTHLERWGEAVKAVEDALKIDEQAGTLETDFVDDALFAALLGEARALGQRDLPSAISRLSYYRTIFPQGRHASDVDVWTGRLRGEGRDAVIVKDRS